MPEPETTLTPAPPDDVTLIPITQATTAVFTEMYFRNTFLFFIVSGTKKVDCPINGQMVGEKGELMVFPTGSMVTMENHPRRNDNYQAVGVSFSQELVRQVYFERKAATQRDGVQRVQAESHDPFVILKLIEHTLEHDGLPQEIRQHRLLEPLIWLKSIGVTLFHAHDESPLSRVRAVIESDIERAWKSQDVADELAMSESTMRRALSQSGNRFSDVLRNTRLENGLALLQSTDVPVTEVALMSGFKSPSHFSDAFKERFKIKPSEIRHPDN